MVGGVMTFLVGERVVEAGTGSFIRIPAGVPHGFENRSDAAAGVFNVFIPGGFEEKMPQIVEWFASHPEGEAARGASAPPDLAAEAGQG